MHLNLAAVWEDSDGYSCKDYAEEEYCKTDGTIPEWDDQPVEYANK